MEPRTIHLTFLILTLVTLVYPYDSQHHQHRQGPHTPKGDNPDDYLDIWPLPNNLNFGNATIGVVPGMFSFKPIGVAASSDLLTEAFARYVGIMFAWGNGTGGGGTPLLSIVNVEVDTIDDNLQLDMDESYTMIIGVNGEPGSILAPRVWGVLHALETLSQLVLWNRLTESYIIRHAPYYISDKPRFSWRGLLIDTSRHFLPVRTILRTIDALSYNKMNVLHWHATDAESMPVESKIYPDLALKGAYSPEGIYSQDDIKGIIKYGKMRGVRVLPEFDMPGHNYAYGLGVPNLILDCPITHPIATEFESASFNPISEDVYIFLKAFLGEMSTLFTDSVLHLGGDEVVYECWNQTQSILDYMKVHNISELRDLYILFEQRVHEIVLKYGKIPMAWDEVFTSASSVLPPNAIVQVWRGDKTLIAAIQQGFRVVSSSDYYLNDGFDYPDNPVQVQWTDIYFNDPMPKGITSEQEKLMLGAEASIWGEQVTDLNIDQRVWFRANVLAERLWSNVISSRNDVVVRVMKQDCRLVQRGIACTSYEQSDIFPRRDLRRVCELNLPPKKN